MTTLEQFIDNFAEQFEMTDRSEFTPSTAFKDLEEWDSLIALSIIGMTKNTYNVTLVGGDIRTLDTIEQIYNLIQSKSLA